MEVGTVSQDDELDFGGIVVNGLGNFSQSLVVPSRKEFPESPHDWPEKLEPGTLNVRVFSFPTELHRHRLCSHEIECEDCKCRFPPLIDYFDSGAFEPAFVIPRNRITGNHNLGDAQVWRATIGKGSGVNPEDRAWVLRRKGSRMGPHLELVADRRLRTAHDLKDGEVVTVRMFGRWLR